MSYGMGKRKRKPKKHKVTRKLAELTDVDVNFISLVGRGANRIPFRVLKDDSSADSESEDMIHLTRKSARKPELVAIVIKGMGLEQASALVEKAGASIDDPEVIGDSIAYTQAPFSDEDNLVGIVHSDTVLTIHKNVKLPVKKAFQAYNEVADFNVNVSSQSFFPGMMMAQEALGETMRSALQEASGPEDAISMVDKILTDFHEYVMEMVSGLPTLAFKFEKLDEEESPVSMESVDKADDDSKEIDMSDKDQVVEKDVTPTPEGESPVSAEVAVDADAEVPAGGAEVSAETEVEAEAPADVAAEATAEAPTPVVSEAAPTQGDEVLKMISSVATSMEGVAKSIQTLNDNVTKLNERVDTVEGVAKEAKESIDGALVIGATADDGAAPAKESMKKSDDLWQGVMPGLPVD